MKRFKITKKYFSPDPSDCLYRVHEREFLFFWNHLSSHDTLPKAKHHIASILENDSRLERFLKDTPDEEVVSYQ